ncbi:MAG: YraN family protein [Anaerolineales bacterium]|nr:YraN family protein [Anaerolineales bacterium]
MADATHAPADPRKRLGAAGETLAVQKLIEAGFTIHARNWRCRAGEIDIVAEEDAPDYARGLAAAPWLVLVEVRTRRGDAFGTALQSITPAKQRKLRTVAGHYLAATGWTGPWRIDVVAIQLDRQGHLVEIEHVKGAVLG